MVEDMTRTYAGKSGSTNADRWMIGFSPQLVSAVWTGYDDGKSLELTVDKGHAKKIWIDFMEKAARRRSSEVRSKPLEGTVGVHIDPATGKLATNDCPVQRFTYFTVGTEPTDYCIDHIEHEDHPFKDEHDSHTPKGRKAKSTLV